MTDYAIEPRAEAFPAAQVPGASSLAEVMEAWRVKGLTPVQVTDGDVTQTITIKHNAITGKIEWSASRIDGVQAVAVMFSALVDMGEVFFTAKARPPLTSGTARIALLLDGDNVQMMADPVNDPTVIRGLLSAALLSLIERGKDGAEQLASIMQFEVKR